MINKQDLIEELAKNYFNQEKCIIAINEISDTLMEILKQQNNSEDERQI